MLPKITVVSTIIVMMFVGAFSFISKAKSMDSNTVNAYSFSYAPKHSDDPPFLAHVTGHDCDHLRGIISNKNRPEHKYYDGSFFCVPRIKNVGSILKNGHVQYISGIGMQEIAFPNGLLLISNPPSHIEDGIDHEKLRNINEKVLSDTRLIPDAAGFHARYYKIKYVFNCENDPRVFCPTVTSYSLIKSLSNDHPPSLKTEDLQYKIYVWGDNLERINSKYFEETLLFSRSMNHLIFANAYGVPSTWNKPFGTDETMKLILSNGGD